MTLRDIRPVIQSTELPYQRDQFYRRDRRSVPAARRLAEWALRFWGLAEWTRAEDVALCTSELATNALLHGVPPGRGFLLRVRYDGAVVRVEVHDSGSGTLWYWTGQYGADGRITWLRHGKYDTGKTPAVAVLRECWVAPSTDQALEEYAENVMTSHRFYYEAGGYSPLADPWIEDLKSVDEFTYDKVSADRFIVGSPEHCIEEIERWHEELGADYFVMRYRHPAGPDHEKALASMRLFGEKVIPHFA